MTVSLNGSICKVIRERGDSPIYSDSTLLHHVKLNLIGQGYDVIKKRMWKDGHMVSDSCQYIRSRKMRKMRNGVCQLMIWDSAYAVRDLAEDYRKGGIVRLEVVRG